MIAAAAEGEAAELAAALGPRVTIERYRLCLALLEHGGQPLRERVVARLKARPWLCALCARALLGRLRLGAAAARTPSALPPPLDGDGGIDDDDDDDALVVLAARSVPPSLRAHAHAQAWALGGADASALPSVAAERRAQAAVVPLALGLCEGLGAHDGAPTAALRRALVWQLQGGGGGHEALLPPPIEVPKTAPPWWFVWAALDETGTTAPQTAASTEGGRWGRATTAQPAERPEMLRLELSWLGRRLEMTRPSALWRWYGQPRWEGMIVAFAAALPRQTTVLSCALIMLMGGLLL